MTAPLVGLIGKKRSGKDAFASRLVEAHGFQRLAFADPLKAAVLDANPILSVELDETHLFPESLPAQHPRLRWVVAEIGWERAKELREVRRLLQATGVAMREHVDPELWVWPVLDKVIWHRADDEPVVVTDVRFPNEAQAIRRDGGKLVRVVRPGVPSDDRHVSETALDDYRVDYVATNGGSLDDLRNVADHLAWWLGEQA